MSTRTATVWRIVHAERRKLAAELRNLPEEEWRTPSLCRGWDIRDVLAHLLDTARTTRLSFVRDMLVARGNFDRANARGIARMKRSDPQETLRAFCAAIDLTRTPPANITTRIVEAIVHGEDIRRPVGLAGAYPESATAQALEYQLRAPVAFGGGRERVRGLTLVDTVTGATWGDGARSVEGPALDLLLAVSGRPINRERFAGNGVHQFLAGLKSP